MFVPRCLSLKRIFYLQLIIDAVFQLMMELPVFITHLIFSVRKENFFTNHTRKEPSYTIVFNDAFRKKISLNA